MGGTKNAFQSPLLRSCTTEWIVMMLIQVRPGLSGKGCRSSPIKWIGRSKPVCFSQSRLAVDQRDVVDAEGVLHRGQLEQLLEDRLGVIVDSHDVLLRGACEQCR